MHCSGLDAVLQGAHVRGCGIQYQAHAYVYGVLPEFHNGPSRHLARRAYSHIMA